MPRMKGFGFATLVLAFGLGATGCAGVDPIKVIGTYEVTVTRDGRTDSVLMDVEPGWQSDLVLNFTDGFSTPATGSNSTGLRANLDGGLNVIAQPCHVTHSSGVLDGSISGKGRLDGTLSITLNFSPTNLPGTTSLQYELEGSKR
jgi:hypothetical protein